VAVLLALGFATLVGLINGLLVTKGRIVPFIATLGTMTVLRGMLLTYTQQQPISGSDPAFTWWGNGAVGIIPVPTLIALLLLAGLGLFLHSTRAGRNLFAIGGNREAAHLAGIPVDRFVTLAFMASGFLAGISGVLVAARINSANVQLGVDTPLLSIAAAIIGGASLLGGRGRMLGSFLGILALGMLTNGMNLVGVTTHFQIAIRASILIAVVALDAFTRKMSSRWLNRSNLKG
jgi:ribose transport system permease protein